MPSLASALGNDGAAPKFEHGGKVYEVSYLTQAVKAAFEQWIIDRTLGVLSKLRDTLPPAEYAAEKEQLFDDVAGGKFGFHGEVAARAMKTPDGNIVLTSLLFGCGADEMVRLVAERGPDVKDVVEMVVRQSSPGQKKSTPSPSRAVRRGGRST